MPLNLSISVIKGWAKETYLEMVEAAKAEQTIVCMVPVEDILVPLIIRLDCNGYIVFFISIARDVRSDLRLYQKALETSSTVPAKLSLHRKNLMLAMDVPVHQGFSDEDFREVLTMLKLILEECFWELKFIGKETQKSNRTPDSPSRGSNWPKRLLSAN